MIRTTILKDIKTGQDSNFTWGEAISIEHIGEYSIIKYHPWEKEGISLLTGNPNYNDIAYSCYIDGNDIGRSCDSLDEAIVACIAYKHDGCNSQAGHFFMKMITN